MVAPEKSNIISQLKNEILRMEGFKSIANPVVSVGLGALNSAFPNATFPTGCIHEFISASKEDAAATSGFVSGLLSLLMKNRIALWISSSRTLFPPALKQFGIEPDHFIFSLKIFRFNFSYPDNFLIFSHNNFYFLAFSRVNPGSPPAMPRHVPGMSRV